MWDFFLKVKGSTEKSLLFVGSFVVQTKFLFIHHLDAVEPICPNSVTQDLINLSSK